MKLTIKGILKHIGNDKLELFYDSAEYFYFTYDDPDNNIFEDHSVYVPRLNRITLESWVQEANILLQLVKQNEEDKNGNGN